MHAPQRWEGFEILACPETKQKVVSHPLKEAERMLPGGAHFAPRASAGAKPFGSTPLVLLREDRMCAYPIVEGIPILMVPERLTAAAEPGSFDLSDPKYAEAYEEMTHYNEVATREVENIKVSQTYKCVEPVMHASAQELASFPHPRHVWLDATYDCAAQWDAYAHVAPMPGKRVLQLGGKGIHAAKFLLAGAAEAWVATPMLGEAQCALALARAAGLGNRLRSVVAVAEELPFTAESFDVVYSGSCMHHTVTALAFPEIVRVLRAGGKFGALDPWRTPLWRIGTKVFGKREKNVYCRPMTEVRVQPLRQSFRRAQVVHHGALTRYPLLALSKLGIASRMSTVWWLNHLDDSFSSAVPGLRGLGSSVALLGEK